MDDTNGKSDLFKLQIDGNTRVNLGTYLGGARWSPNGNWISLLNQNETGYELLILPAEGGEEARRLYQSADYFDYDWLPEEKEIFISQFGDESMEAYLLSLETGETKRLADPIIDDIEYVIRAISWTP
jgi:Tol biopolymer transport system component